jgi:cytochrome b subunit of formate dehydrogenase
MQKTTYFVMPLVAAMIVVSGIAIWKPVSLGWLTGLLGGYVWARYWHFLSMVALVALSLAHVFMVLSVDPYSLRSMITGGHSDRLSPIARNARPFQGLWPRRSPRGSTATRAAEGETGA